MKKNHSTIGILLRGMAMGAADVVPGVSGGTMALITGIYERLIAAVGAITKDGLQILKKQGVSLKSLKSAWQVIDGTFLLTVGVGILLSVLTVARGISWALEQYPPVVWAFFFGLIVASAWFVAKGVKQWKARQVVLLVGLAIGLVLISRLTPVSTPEAGWFIFVSGMIAISAMILPGVSGSFLLVLLGKYEFILQAVHDLNISVLAILAAGCAVGLLTSARIIAWLFKKYHDETMAGIVGVMIGSLYTVWPWRQITSYTGDPTGDDFRALTDRPVLPATYQAEDILGVDPGLAAQDPFVLASVVAFGVGMLVVVGISLYAQKKSV